MATTMFRSIRVDTTDPIVPEPRRAWITGARAANDGTEAPDANGNVLNPGWYLHADDVAGFLRDRARALRSVAMDSTATKADLLESLADVLVSAGV